MKTRIIGMLLVVVMVVMALAGCGYTYVGEDYSSYVKFDKAALDKFLTNIEINDGDFAEGKRDKKVEEEIYAALAKAVDTDKKVTDGVAGEYDVLYYCYFVTVKGKDGKDAVIFADKMKESSATKLALGDSEAEGLNAGIQEKIKEYNFTDNAYKVKTEGKAESGKVAYISYKVSYTEKVDGKDKAVNTTYTYERVTLGDESHDVALKLVGADIGTTLTVKDENDKDTTSFKIGEKTYSNAKVDWVVEAGTEFTVTDKTYTSATSKTAVDGTKLELKDEELTYHIFPVYYLEVAEFTAEEVIKTLLSSLSVDSLPSFKAEAEEGADEAKKAEIEASNKKIEEAIKKINELKEKLDEAIDAIDNTKTGAKKAVEDAEDALEKAEKNTGENRDDLIATAKKTLENAQKKLAEAEGKLAEAEKALDAGVAELFKLVPAETVQKEYKEMVYDGLLAEYEHEIKINLAEAIWEEIDVLAEVATPDNKFIKPIYDRMMDYYKYDFYNNKHSSGKTNYKEHGGNFDEYLKEEMQVADKDVIHAKNKVWAEAEDTARSIFTVFEVARLYGVSVTAEDIEEFKNDPTSSYSYYESYYGDANIEVAVQFDKFMNHLLEWETDEDDKVVYVDGKIKFLFEGLGYTTVEEK